MYLPCLFWDYFSFHLFQLPKMSFLLTPLKYLYSIIPVSVNLSSVSFILSSPAIFKKSPHFSVFLWTALSGPLGGTYTHTHVYTKAIASIGIIFQAEMLLSLSQDVIHNTFYRIWVFWHFKTHQLSTTLFQFDYSIYVNK